MCTIFPYFISPFFKWLISLLVWSQHDFKFKLTFGCGSGIRPKVKITNCALNNLLLSLHNSFVEGEIKLKSWFLSYDVTNSSTTHSPNQFQHFVLFI